jgi:uncharacterized membrane protein YhhN
MRLSVYFDIVAWLTALAALFLLADPAASKVLPWIKATPALCWALSFLAARTPGWFLMAPALAAAALGDFFLGQGNSVIAGSAAFGVMQILYAICFWTLTARGPGFHRGTAIAPLVYAALTGLVLAFCLPLVGDLALPMAVYGLLLAFMASGSATARPGGILALGGALFFLSDALILIFRAWPVSFPTDWVILVPYYLGQGLIVRALRRK